MMQLKELLPQTLAKVAPSLNIEGIAYKIDDVKKNYLFVARKGEKFDSHKLIGKAKSMGAVCAICEYKVDIDLPQIIVDNVRDILAYISHRFYGEPSKKLQVVGITGTNGKTTSTHLIRHILETCGISTGLIGTVNYVIGKRMQKAGLTTPESLDIAKMMNEMLKNGNKVCVMEVSSHAISLLRTKYIDFDIAGLTNIGRDHLDFHGSLENYIATKIELFKTLAQDKFAVLNHDINEFEQFRKSTRAKVLTYGKKGDIKYKLLRSDFKGLVLEIFHNGEKNLIESKLLGEHNVGNILLAFGVAKTLGIPVEKIKEGIETFTGVRGRFERIGNVIIDYAHTPDAMEKVLNSARKLTNGRIICVFGCGGDRDRGKRPIMGKVATTLSDFTIITSDNPRSEPPLKIIEDIEKGAKPHRYKKIISRKEAIEEAIQLANGNDLVLLLGKGHEDYQIIGNERIPFDEHEFVKKCLRKKESICN